MNKNRQNEIRRALWNYNGGKITEAQIDKIVKDKAERHFAICTLRGMGIRLSHDYRTLSFGEKAMSDFRRRKDIERELTIQRKQERQHKELLRTA
jgi:hypothetical protein